MAGPDAELRDLAKDLRRTAEGKVLLKALLKRLRETAKREITPESRRRALTILPSRGGLAARVAKSPQRITARAGNTTATVAVTVPGKSKGSGAADADRGSVRHPVFNQTRADGGRVFVTQNVPPRWFSDTAEKAAPAVVKDALDGIRDTARDAGFT